MNTLLKTITVLSLCASASAFSTPASVPTTTTTALSMADEAPDIGKINTLIDLDAAKVVNMEVSF
jgi:hypothetical protein